MIYSKFKKMKRLFVFAPAILLVLFLLISFVLKEKDATKVIGNKSGLETSFLNLQMADKPGRTSAKGCPKICGKIVSGEIASLQMIKGCF